jgi:hypothetical protein
MDNKIQGEYAMKAGTPQPIFMKAIEIFRNQEIDVRKVETNPAYTRTPWLVDENETIDLTMCAIPKGASKERIKAEFKSLMADKYEEYDQICSDGSLKDDKVGLGIVTNNQIIKKRIKIQCRRANDHNGNGKFNTNEQTDDHSHGPGTRKQGISGD